MKYIVAMFPSKNLQDLANSYRKRYDPSYALISPHIKLKSSFEASDEEIKGIAKELHDIAKETLPLSIGVYKIKSFHPTNNVIYFAIKKTDDLYDIHERLHQGNLKTDEKYNYSFVPHITIGQDLSDQEHSDVIGRLGMMDLNHTETVDRFHLLYQLENGSWTVYETFRFGKDNE
jgi:2'-5' RNA ligase